MNSRGLIVLRDRLYTARNKAYVRLFARSVPFYVVNEFPKSGGTWLTQMMSDAMDLPFHRNAFVKLERAVIHGHYLNPIGLGNVVVLWRDPRDVIVSFYHHCYFVSEYADVMFGNRQLVSLMKERCPFADYNDVRTNLPAFIRFISTTPVAPRYSWAKFVSIWANRPGTIQTSYEALRADTAGELTRIIKAVSGQDLSPEHAAQVAEAHSFARAKAAADRNKTASTERSFVREGSVGGWQTQFSDAALQELVKCGYTEGIRRLSYPV